MVDTPLGDGALKVIKSHLSAIRKWYLDPSIVESLKIIEIQTENLHYLMQEAYKSKEKS